jgi:hypothetical protein
MAIFLLIKRKINDVQLAFTLSGSAKWPCLLTGLVFLGKQLTMTSMAKKPIETPINPSFPPARE